MSNRAITAVLDYSKTHGSTRLLLVVVADGTGKDTGVYIANVNTLAWQVHCGRRNLQYLIGKAVTAGELIVWERTGHASLYAIPIYDGEPGYDPQPCHDERHICLGTHTPLSVSREGAKRDEIRQQRGQRRVRGAEDFAPPASEGNGVQETAHPPRKGLRPPVQPVAPTHAEDCAHYPSVTPLLPDSVPTASHTPSQAPSYAEWKAEQPAGVRDHFDRKASAGLLAYRLWCAANGMEARQ